MLDAKARDIWWKHFPNLSANKGFYAHFIGKVILNTLLNETFSYGPIRSYIGLKTASSLFLNVDLACKKLETDRTSSN